MEGLGQTTKGAPFHFFGYFEDGEVKRGIEVPKMLSVLAFHDPNATVEGLDAVPVDDQPPVNVVRFAFQTMVGIGTLLAAIGAFYLVVWWRKRRLPKTVWFYRAVSVAGPLALVALIAGWITTEVGRQPWIVYETMRTADAVTAAGGVPVAFAVVVAVYIGLAFAVAWLLRRLARRSPETEIGESVPGEAH